MSYNDLAKGRCSIENQVYFVTAVVNQRRPVFEDFYFFLNVIANMKLEHTRGSVDSIAWIVMPDHFHWLFALNHGNELAKVIKAFKGRSARDLNKYLGTRGSFWQHAYYDHALRKDEDIKQVARYIVANPLRAGLVEKIEDYPHWDAIWL